MIDSNSEIQTGMIVKHVRFVVIFEFVINLCLLPGVRQPLLLANQDLHVADMKRTEV